MTESDLEDLLEKAREKNDRLKVTGALVYEGGHFLQALEGERSTVRDLFEEISKDDRHYDVRILIEDSLRERQFANWSMAWSKVSNKSLLTTFNEISEEAGASTMISPDLERIRRFLTVLHGFL